MGGFYQPNVTGSLLPVKPSAEGLGTGLLDRIIAAVRAEAESVNAARGKGNEKFVKALSAPPVKAPSAGGAPAINLSDKNVKGAPNTPKVPPKKKKDPGYPVIDPNKTGPQDFGGGATFEFLPPPQNLPTNPISEHIRVLHDPVPSGVAPEEKIDIRGVGQQGPPAEAKMDPYEQFGLMLASQLAGPRGGVFSNQLAQRQSQIEQGNEGRIEDWRRQQMEDRLEEDRIAAEQRAIEAQKGLAEFQQGLQQQDPLYKGQLEALQQSTRLKPFEILSNWDYRERLLQDRAADNLRQTILGMGGLAGRINPLFGMGQGGDDFSNYLLSQIPGFGGAQGQPFNAARLPQSAVAKIQEALSAPDARGKLTKLGVIEKAATAAGDSATLTEVQKLMAQYKSQI